FGEKRYKFACDKDLYPSVTLLEPWSCTFLRSARGAVRRSDALAKRAGKVGYGAEDHMLETGDPVLAPYARAAYRLSYGRCQNGWNLGGGQGVSRASKASISP